MSDYSAEKENELHRDRAILRKRGQDILEDVDETLRKGKSATDPRKQFNNWLRSLEGKAWKREEFQRCKGICSYCGEQLREVDAVVHHVEPITKFGNLANRLENYRLLHPNCNNSIGTKVVEFLD